MDLIDKFNRKYRYKKYLNLVVSAMIVVFGITSFIYGLHLEPSVTVFRFMTVDGTMFTTIASVVCIVVNIFEAKRNTELTSLFVYYIRLSSAVAEMVIFLVVILSHFPIFGEYIPMFDRYDSFIMHVILPVLTVTSFAVNDSPIGKLKPMKRWHGTWFITIYAIVILTLVTTGALEHSLIPYFFLDVVHNPFWLTIVAFIVIYGIAYLMAWFLSEVNRKLSWKWYKGFSK